jgi:hypothetical protein
MRWWWWAVCAGCGASGSPPSSPQASVHDRPTTAVLAAEEPAAEKPAAALPRPAPLTSITDRATLDDLERRGYDLGSLLDGAPATENATLVKGARFGVVVTRLELDVAEAKRKDPLSGVGMAKSHRLFDVRWFRSASARFELIGVVNRLDRRPFAIEGTCGETRFVYRLAYAANAKGTAVASRLPATIALTTWVREPDCAAAARRWQIAETADALVAGPLARDRISNFRSLEINLQRVRWPSTTRPDLAGHAEYLMRVFEKDAAGALVVGPLENTPDETKRTALLEWLKRPENIERLDRGTLVIPRAFLATSAISVSPRGLGRRANRPFRRLFDPKDFAGVDLAGRANVATAAALIRRLDGFTCNGCHQSRSIAGFHLLGEETAPPGSANAIAVAASPHLERELVRRSALLSALAEGVAHDDSIPPPERDPQTEGRYGAPCGLGDPGFARWTCAPGLICDDAEGEVGDEVGTCLPASPGVGDPCEVGRVGRQDRITTFTRRTCAGVCETNQVGFPAGMCSGFGKGAVVGGIPILGGFNDCLGKNVPFETCIAENIRPAGLRGCGPGDPCRDDYVCARTKSGVGPPGTGACMPPYFLFQLRVDGHPSEAAR